MNSIYRANFSGKFIQLALHGAPEFIQLALHGALKAKVSQHGLGELRRILGFVLIL